MPSWLEWFKLKRGPSKPVCRQLEIGEVHIESGTLLFGDPAELDAFTRIDGIPPGSYSVQALTIYYPKGGFSRVAKIGIRFRPGTADSQKKIGDIGGESSMIMAVDADTLKTHWQEVGPARFGITSGKDCSKIAKLIQKRFGMKWEPRSICSAKSVQPISEELEAEITAYLETFPEYGRNSFLYFYVETENSYQRIAQSLCENAWSEVELDPASHASVLAFTSGYGDGWYELTGIFKGETLLGIESEFITADMDDALKDAPAFRY